MRAFADENRERHADEERRLAYVALTRTRRELLLTGSWWATQTAPRAPSPFLRELAVAGIVDPRRCPTAPEHEPRTRARARARASAGRSSRSAVGARRCGPPPTVRAAAERPSGAGIGPRLADEIRLLLEERRRRLEGPGAAASPPASPRRGSRTTSTTPARSPSSCAGRCRSAPTGRPASARSSTRGSSSAPRARATPRRSTTHGWAAAAHASRAGESITDATAERLRALQATFEASEWGGRRPVAVELELHLPIDEHVFVCKLDAVYECRPTESGRPRHPLPGRGLEDGPAPRDARDLELKQTQLALYRLAYANWAGVEPETVDAVFYFVEDDLVIRPDGSTTRRRSPLVGVGRGVRVAGADPLSRLAGRRVAPVAEVERDRRGGVHRQRARSPASRRSSSEKS